MEYKETLNLPQTKLEMRANAIKKEPETQKFWEENHISLVWNLEECRVHVCSALGED